MIRAGLLALLIAGPAGAEGICPAAWDKVSAALGGFGTVTGKPVQDGDWCLVRGLKLDLDGQYLPDWHMDGLRFRGAAVGWLVDGTGGPDGLEVAVEGLRLVVQTGNAQLDYLLAAQARANPIQAELSLAWAADKRLLRLEGLSIDFPGDNQLDLSAEVTGVDLSSTGAMQMSATGFAVTRADLRVRTHGLFEAYLLMPLGSALLPQDGDMTAAVEALRTRLIAGIVNLPDTSFSAESKDALLALGMELPNPSGEATVALRAAPGIGPARLAGYALTGGEVAEAASLFQGVTVEVGWTHSDAP